MNNRVDIFVQNLLSINQLKAKELIQESTLQTSSIECTEEIILPAMERIGEMWESGEIALSQVYMSGRICEEIVNTILDSESPKIDTAPKIAIAVFQDYHCLGKRIVSSVLHSAGYNIHDYGMGLTITELVEKSKKDKIKILLLSTLMLNSALNIKELKEEFLKENMEVKLIVGGAPFRFDPELYKRIGADAMAAGASDVVAVIKKVTEGEL